MISSQDPNLNYNCKGPDSKQGHILRLWLDIPFSKPLFNPLHTYTQLWPACTRWARQVLATVTNSSRSLRILPVSALKALCPRKLLKSQANWMVGCPGISSERLLFIMFTKEKLQSHIKRGRKPEEIPGQKAWTDSNVRSNPLGL